jgi:hypothetical protein
MKGVVFTEFLEMVEQRFSADLLDRIIDAAALPSGGAYTAVGTYDHAELVSLVGELSAVVKVPVPELVRAFGHHLFGRFFVLYPEFFAGVGTAFEFLKNIERYVHVEVRKLYPDAQLPTFEHSEPDATTLVLTYRSERPFADFAEGLIRGCIAHFEEPIELERTDLSPNGTAARFTMTKRAA